MFESKADLTNHATDRFNGLVFGGANPRGAVKSANFPAVRQVGPHSGSVEELALIKEVFRRCGILAEGYRLAPLLRRLPACLRALRTPDAGAALDLLESHPQALEVAVNSLLIGTTGFFRDPAVFARLESAILPEICSRVENPRIWSAACSDGSELCSVAMLVAGQGALDRTEFLGTDCRESAIRAASRGSYPLQAAAAMDPHIAESFFSRRREILQSRAEFAARLHWQCADVFLQENRGLWDLILCRNLAIYLEPAHMMALWRRLESALAPGGVLVVGRAEKPQLPGLRRIAPCIYQTRLRHENSHD